MTWPQFNHITAPSTAHRYLPRAATTGASGEAARWKAEDGKQWKAWNIARKQTVNRPFSLLGISWPFGTASAPSVARSQGFDKQNPKTHMLRSKHLQTTQTTQSSDRIVVISSIWFYDCHWLSCQSKQRGIYDILWVDVLNRLFVSSVENFGCYKQMKFTFSTHPLGIPAGGAGQAPSLANLWPMCATWSEALTSTCYILIWHNMT